MQSKHFLLPKINHINDFKTLARSISLVENDTVKGQEILQHLEPSAIPIIGITGPPVQAKARYSTHFCSFYYRKTKK